MTNIPGSPGNPSTRPAVPAVLRPPVNVAPLTPPVHVAPLAPVPVVVKVPRQPTKAERRANLRSAIPGVPCEWMAPTQIPAIAGIPAGKAIAAQPSKILVPGNVVLRDSTAGKPFIKDVGLPPTVPPVVLTSTDQPKHVSAPGTVSSADLGHVPENK